MNFKKNALAVLTITTLMTAPVMANNSWQGEAKDAWLDGKLETALLLNTQLNNFNIDTDIDNGVAVLSGQVKKPNPKRFSGRDC
ncbi:hypothetical protein A9E74_01595 [Methylophaga muralis]|uniref:BON domain-containing protein n=2 Tax=Methylophaga muralis TaxID=291169 RepID=A0A1E3GRS4_9GAMM|nr:hypothetical protein A9E74_01595 [Methylophaga muralis]